MGGITAPNTNKLTELQTILMSLILIIGIILILLAISIILKWLYRVFTKNKEIKPQSQGAIKAFVILTIIFLAIILITIFAT